MSGIENRTVDRYANAGVPLAKHSLKSRCEETLLALLKHARHALFNFHPMPGHHPPLNGTVSGVPFPAHEDPSPGPVLKVSQQL